MPMRCVLLLPLLALAAAADDGLASRDAKERAWAAHRVAEKRDGRVQPQLEQLLADKHVRVREAALDALIRTKAHVKWELLQPSYKTFRDEVVILLALHTKKHEKTMLAQVGKERDALVWRTFCNQLVSRRTPGFAALLMTDLPVTLSITVHDNGNIVIGLGGGCGGFRCGRPGRRNPPQGWPPRMRYALSTGAGALPLTGGRKPTGYVRFKAPRRPRAAVVPTVAERFGYIAELAGQRLPLQTIHMASIEDDLPPFLVQQVADARREVDRAYAVTIGLLKKRGVLTDREIPALAPKISTQIYDHRADKKTPLPKLG